MENISVAPILTTINVYPFQSRLSVAVIFKSRKNPQINPFISIQIKKEKNELIIQETLSYGQFNVMINTRKGEVASLSF